MARKIVADWISDCIFQYNACSASKNLASNSAYTNFLNSYSINNLRSSLGYKPFMLAISNQIPFLTSVINTRERRMSMVKTRIRTSSTGSLDQDPKTPPPLESKLPPPLKIQEVSKQVRKESPSTPVEPAMEAIPTPPRVIAPKRVETSTGCAVM